MKINIFKTATFLLAVMSLLLPWFTGTFFISTREYTHLANVEFSPLLVDYTSMRSDNGTSRSGRTVTSEFTTKIACPISLMSLLQGMSIGRGTYYPYIITSLLTYSYLFCISFVVIGLLATGFWEKYSARIDMAIAFMGILGIFFFLIGEVWFYNHSFQLFTIAITTFCEYSESGIQIVYSNSNFFSSGFFCGLLTVTSLLLSYLHPIFINLPVKLGSDYLKQIRAYWSTTLDIEKFLVIPLNSLLLTWLLGYLLFFNIP